MTVPDFAVELARDVARVTGPDALPFLQGQLSQDVARLERGESAWSFLLQPAGKVDAWLRVSRTGPDEFILDVDHGFGDLVVARLERFKLRTKADITPLTWRCVAVRGSDPEAVATGVALAAASPTSVVVAADWPGVAAVDVLGPDVEAVGGMQMASVELEYEALRIECGVPKMGRELTERTIPAESGVVERSVSFTKGCYTGQELVARIDSRGGNVPRRLRGLVVQDDEVPLAGTAILVNGSEVGAVTSSARSPWRGAAVALAYLKRDVEPPVEASVGGRVATVAALPLLRSPE